MVTSQSGSRQSLHRIADDVNAIEACLQVGELNSLSMPYRCKDTSTRLSLALGGLITHRKALLTPL